MIFTTPHSEMLKDFWVICPVDNTAADHRPQLESPESQYYMRKEYRISDLAYYLMSPNPITVRKKLIGCEVHYKMPTHSLWAEKLGKAIPHIASRKRVDRETPPEILMARPGIGTAFSRDVNFKNHLGRLDEYFRSYDAMVKSLQEIDKSAIEDVIGICQEPDGNHTRLALKGGIAEKVEYVKRFFNHELDVVLKSALIADNYFEIKGFDFKAFNPKNRFRLTLFHNGKDKNHIRFAYEKPEKIDNLLNGISERLDAARSQVEPFELSSQIQSVRKVKMLLLLVTALSLVCGVFFPPALVLTGLAGIGAIFMFIQENNHKAQEKIQQETQKGTRNPTKHIEDLIPEVLYDPRNDKELMARISEPTHRNMKGGFRHDPYQSGNLHTPAHKRVFLGAHAKSPIIYIDELKTLVSSGYMPDLLEIMQNNEYILEGGSRSGSGAADRAENALKANNIIIASCNHDTLGILQNEGDGAFLSRIEDKGEIIQMESAVPETSEALAQVVQYIKQEIINLGEMLEDSWGEIVENEGREGLRKRSEQIFGTSLPYDYDLTPREFSRGAIMEVIKELRCRASDRKLSGILRPINGIILTAEFAAINAGAERVESEHVRHALREHVSLEGALAREIQEQKNHLKRYITAMTDSIGYVVGLAVIQSRSSGAMHGQPLPIHGQIDVGGTDTVTSPGKIGDIAKAAAQNVRASIKKVFRKLGAPPVGYEMHVEYVQAHSGVEGDSASVAMDAALISDYIQQPVSQRFGVTGSLTGNIILAVGGVTEKVKSIMDASLKMQGACIPWQNKYDLEPLLLNTDFALNTFKEMKFRESEFSAVRKMRVPLMSFSTKRNTTSTRYSWGLIGRRSRKK